MILGRPRPGPQLFTRNAGWGAGPGSSRGFRGRGRQARNGVPTRARSSGCMWRQTAVAPLKPPALPCTTGELLPPAPQCFLSHWPTVEVTDPSDWWCPRAVEGAANKRRLQVHRHLVALESGAVQGAPRPARKPGRLRKMHAPSTILVTVTPSELRRATHRGGPGRRTATVRASVPGRRLDRARSSSLVKWAP